MSRALALAVLLLAAAAVAPLASAQAVEPIPGANEIAGANEAAGANEPATKIFPMATGADPEPSPAGGLPADPAPDARH